MGTPHPSDFDREATLLDSNMFVCDVGHCTGEARLEDWSGNRECPDFEEKSTRETNAHCRCRSTSEYMPSSSVIRDSVPNGTIVHHQTHSYACPVLAGVIGLQKLVTSTKRNSPQRRFTRRWSLLEGELIISKFRTRSNQRPSLR